MKEGTKNNIEYAGIGKSILTGEIVYLVLIVLCSAIAAALINSLVVSEKRTGYCIAIILIIASFGGGRIVSAGIQKKKTLVMGMLCGIFLTSLIIVNTILGNGEHKGVQQTGILLFCGTSLSAMRQLKRNEKKRKANKKIHSR